jgi:HD-GYP domain-containing protein (c-di-GMP phosphodiesterase class II)
MADKKITPIPVTHCGWRNGACQCAIQMRSWHTLMCETLESVRKQPLRTYLTTVFKGLFLQHFPYCGILLVIKWPNDPPIVISHPLIKEADAFKCLEVINEHRTSLAKSGWNILQDLDAGFHNSFSRTYHLDGHLIVSPLHDGHGMLLVHGSELTHCPANRDSTGEHVAILAAYFTALMARFSEIQEFPPLLEIDEPTINTMLLSRQIVNSLLIIINSQSTLFGTYPRQVGKVSKAIATQLHLPEEEVHHIRIAALICDIGMVAIADSLVLSNRKLTEEEWEKLRAHPLISVNILGEISLFKRQLALIKHHHERWDGSGYPDGLSGNNIPLGSRIIAVADTYVHLQIERPFRHAYTAEEALNLIRDQSGKTFDPEVVSALECIVRTQDMQEVTFFL